MTAPAKTTRPKRAKAAPAKAPETWGYKLRTARMLKGLSQREVGELADIIQPIVSSYELGDPRYPLDEATFTRLMKAIDGAPSKVGPRVKTQTTKPARLALPARLASQWEGLGIEERSAIVMAGMEYLGR